MAATRVLLPMRNIRVTARCAAWPRRWAARARSGASLHRVDFRGVRSRQRRLRIHCSRSAPRAAPCVLWGGPGYVGYGPLAAVARACRSSAICRCADAQTISHRPRSAPWAALVAPRGGRRITLVELSARFGISRSESRNARFGRCCVLHARGATRRQGDKATR